MFTDVFILLQVRQAKNGYTHTHLLLSVLDVMIKPYAIDKHSTQMTFTLEQGAQVCFMTRSVRSS